MKVRQPYNAEVRASRSTGFTVLELLVTLAIIGIVLAFSTPVTFELYQSYRRAGAKQYLEADLLRASARAATLGTRVIFSIVSNGSRYSYGPDYHPYSVPPLAETTEFSRNLPNKITISPTTALLFDGRGFLVDANGDLTQAQFVLSHRNRPFTNMTVSPTGGVTFD